MSRTGSAGNSPHFSIRVPPTAPTAAAQTLPPTCSIRGWVVFAPGYHKGDLYTPARNEQIVRNFARLTTDLGHTIPRAGLGHDKQQRFAQSLGFGNTGTITRCDSVPDHPGYFDVDIDGVPTEVGGEVNAGRLPGGSVELNGAIRDPQNPALMVPGDVLTGIAFLGEEQPAVRAFPESLRDRARPKATFADGSPVPPNKSPARWLNAMADVTRQMADQYRGQFDPVGRKLRLADREYSAETICFSDFDPTQPGPPMTPEQEAALAAAGFSPEQIAAMKAACPPAAGAAMAGAVPPVAAAPGATPPPTAAMTVGDKSANQAGQKGAMEMYDGWDRPSRNHSEMMSACKAFAADPAATPKDKAFASAFAAVFAELEETKKQTGALQASAEADQKKTEGAAMAAFSAHFEPKLAALVRKVPPVELEKVVRPMLANIGAAKTFASATDRYTAADAMLAPYLARPDDAKLASTVPTAPPATAPDGRPFIVPATPVLNRLVREGGAIDRADPALAKSIRDRVVA